VHEDFFSKKISWKLFDVITKGKIFYFPAKKFIKQRGVTKLSDQKNDDNPNLI
jgi:hypothetical protein